MDFLILPKNHSIRDTTVLETTIIIGTKHLKVFKTIVFKKIMVFEQNSKNTLEPKGA